MRIVFAGTPAFAAAHLEALLEAGREVVAVYTQPDRPAGRGKQLRPSAVKELAGHHGLPVHQPLSLKSAEETEQLSALAPDLMVVVAYGLLLPPAILAVPRQGCLNVHASLLPRWRGAAPIERAILAGDAETGVTIMQMDAGLDTGDMLYQLSTPIGPDDNGETLTARLTGLGREALLHTLDALETGSLHPRAQDEAGASYAAKLDKAEALIDWNRPATAIQRQINAFFPRSPAFCFFQGDRLRLLAARLEPLDSEHSPGTLLEADKEGLLVKCGEDALRVTQVQLPGRKPVAVRDLLNAAGHSFHPGSRFSSQAEPA